MQLQLRSLIPVIRTVISKAYQETVTNSILYLNHPLHTQIYE